MLSKRIVMVGTALEAQGGVSAVLGVLKLAGLFECCNIQYIASHRDGGRAKKLGAAMSGWFSLMFALSLGKVALLHVHTSSRASFWRKFIFILSARLFRVPYIVHLHSGEFPQFYEIECSPLARRVIGNTFTAAAHVIVLSNSWRAWVRQTFPKAKVERIYNPVFLPERQFHPGADQKIILFLGRVGPKKGIFDLLSALALIKERIPLLRVQIGGEGDLEAVQQLAEDLGISDQIDLLGWVDGERKQALLDQAAVFVLPSYHEGMSMSVLEAMASGLPVISTPVGGTPEAIANGVEGYLVDAGDVRALARRLKMLLDDEDLRRSMGKAAKQKAEREFSVNVIVPQFQDLYAQILPRGRRA